MKEIFGRDKEIEVFEEALLSPQSEFIAVTGRRRIGKTFLISTYFKSALCFHMTGVQSQPVKVQLRAFANELGFRQQRMLSTPESWIEAFAILRTHIESLDTTQKKVLFFDELTWMDTPRSGFLQIFAHFWNSWAAWQKNIVLVIAGSSTSWIINKVYNDTGGLHNRVTKRIWLQPFKLAEAEAFLRSKHITLSRYEIAQLYMTFGGVPFYLNEVKSGESAAQCIQRMCFTEGGLLANEFDNLYAAIFQQPESHLKVVKALAQHNYGLERTDLLKKANIANTGTATKVLDELVATGYVHYMVPFGKKSNGGKYILADFYSRFYLMFVNNRKITNWLHQADSALFKAWSGLAFEWLCHLHQGEIQKVLGISGIQSNVSYSVLKAEDGTISAQIDMLIERADHVINLCEIKFANDIYVLSKSESEAIRRKVSYLRSQLKRRNSIFPVMLTTFGCEKNTHYLGLIQTQLTLDDLFVPR
jgi:uncharacterized protein